MANTIDTIPTTAVCPFTGRPLQIVFSESLVAYCARGEFYSTRWYRSQRELMWHLYHKDGIAPGFNKSLNITLITPEERKEIDVRKASDEQEQRELLGAIGQAGEKVAENLRATRKKR